MRGQAVRHGTLTPASQVRLLPHLPGEPHLPVSTTPQTIQNRMAVGNRPAHMQVGLAPTVTLSRICFAPDRAKLVQLQLPAPSDSSERRAHAGGKTPGRWCPIRDQVRLLTPAQGLRFKHAAYLPGSRLASGGSKKANLNIFSNLLGRLNELA